MPKRRWILLLIIALLLLVVFVKFFDKTLDESAVPADADVIVAVDVKHLIRSVVWNTLTNPSQWTFSRSGKKGKELRDLIDLPDYIFCTHIAGTAYSQWFCVLPVKDPATFSSDMRAAGFTIRSRDNNFEIYQPGKMNVSVIRYHDRILVATGSDTTTISRVAKQLFLSGRHASKTDLQFAENSNDHIAVSSHPGGASERIAMALNFTTSGIKIHADLGKDSVAYAEHDFRFSASDIACMSVSHFPGIQSWYRDDSVHARVNKLLDFEVDSLFKGTNRSYSLNFHSLTSRIDTAVSYSYDENFQAIESKQLTNVLEPSFDLRVIGNDIASIYNYWQQEGLLQIDKERSVFTPIPFVSTTASVKGDTLRLYSEKEAFYDRSVTKRSLGFIHVDFRLLPSDLLRAMPVTATSFISKASTLRMEVRKDAGRLLLDAELEKRDKDKALMSW